MHDKRIKSLSVVYCVLVSAAREHESGFPWVPESDAHHFTGTSEATSHWSVNTARLTPGLPNAHEAVALESRKFLSVLLGDSHR